MKIIFAIASSNRGSRRKVGWAAAIPAIATVASSLINKSAANKNASAASNLQYQPIDLAKLQSDAQATAASNAAKSLQLEAQLRPNLAGARTDLDQQTAADLATGGNLPTDVVNQVTRGSVADANTAGLMGGGGPLTAANLGLTAMQVRNMNQAKASNLLNANQLPAAGLDPGSLASASIGNQNAMNQFNLYKSGVMANANQSSADANSGLLGGLGTLASAFVNKGSSPGTGASSNAYKSYGVYSDAGAVCWVARSVYGEGNPRWMMFRKWLLDSAPAWFRKLYIRHGEAFAAWLDEHSYLKPAIRIWMDSRIA